MIKALISDFDGTLVDTFEANLKAYQHAFQDAGLSLSAETYRRLFGLRFDDFMAAAGVVDEQLAQRIRESKKEYYPMFFAHLRPNTALIELLRTFRQGGGKVAVASTARRENLMNVLEHLDLRDGFDLIFAGMDVRRGKPSSEIYDKAMAALGVSADETLIFEDSETGVQAAVASGAHCMKIAI